MCAQVLKTADSMQKTEISEADILSLETMISEATKAIDKGVSKGVLKANTGARRKSRMSKIKQKLMIQAGMYTPAAAQ